MILALLDGTLLDPTGPLLRADDLGVLRGDGVFETVLLVDGEPRELAAHLDRLARSAAALDLPVPDRAGWCRAVEAVAAAAPVGEQVLRLVLTRGPDQAGAAPTAYLWARPLSDAVRRQRTAGVTAVTLLRGTDPALVGAAPWLLLVAKTLSYAVHTAALREAERRGADEAVFVTDDGRVLEAPTSTVVIADDRTLRTPPASLGILAGITQAALYRAARDAGWATAVEPLRVADLLAADAVWLTSAVRLAAPVRALDGRALAGDTELTREVLDLVGCPRIAGDPVLPGSPSGSHPG